MSTEYLQPKSWEELERELERLTDRSVILAGGTDLLPKIRSGKKEPDIYLSLCQLEPSCQRIFYRACHGLQPGRVPADTQQGDTGGKPGERFTGG